MEEEWKKGLKLKAAPGTQVSEDLNRDPVPKKRSTIFIPFDFHTVRSSYCLIFMLFSHFSGKVAAAPDDDGSEEEEDEGNLFILNFELSSC